MKVKISYTVDIDDKMRRAINEHYGKEGLATRKDVQDWYRVHGESGDDDLAEVAYRENNDN